MSLPLSPLGWILQLIAVINQQDNNKEIALAKAGYEFRLRELQVAADQENNQAKKDIILRALDVGQHIFDRKADFAVMQFKAMSDHINSLHFLYSEELKELIKLRNDCLVGKDPANASLIHTSITEKKNDLLDLVYLRERVSETSMEAVRTLSLEVGTSETAMIEKKL